MTKGAPLPLLLSLAVVLAPVLPPPATAAPPGLSPERVQHAVERGVAWLKGQAGKGGDFTCRYSDAYPAGATALSIFALSAAGVDPNDPVLIEGFRVLVNRPCRKVYSTSTAVLALATRYAPPPDRFRPGTEAYVKECRRRFDRFASEQEKRWLAGATDFLVRSATAGEWAYPDGGADLSNTQFAILALAAAVRLGMNPATAVRGNAPPIRQVFLAALDRLLSTQQKDGPEVPFFDVPAGDALRSGRATGVPEAPFHARGWGYRAEEAPRGSMTAAGLACLVVLKASLSGMKNWEKTYAEPTHRAIRDGAAWLALNMTIPQNPGTDGQWTLYWLFSLQRAGMLTGVERFGRWDWYLNGARWLLEQQADDGRWETDHEKDALVDTAFALLFLRRATTAVLDGPITSGGAPLGGPTVEPLPDGRFRVRFMLQGEEEAEQIILAGTFNEWNTEALPLMRSETNPVWQTAITLPAGTHRYKFIVNGERWIHDPGNPLVEADGHGGLNSLLVLATD